MGTGFITVGITFIKENIKLILVSIVFIVTVLYVNEKRQRAAEKDAYEYVIKQNELNLVAMNDSIRISVNAANEKVSEKMSMVVTNVNELKLYNSELYEDMKNEIGDIQTFMRANLKADIGNNGNSTEQTEMLNDSTYTYNLKNEYSDEGLTHRWESNTEFKIIKKADGTIKITNDPVEILINSIQLEIDLGTKVVGDTTLVFAKSKSDLIEFSDLQSVKIYTPTFSSEAKKKSWGVGPQVGMYLTTDGRFVPAVGIGITYNILKF